MNDKTNPYITACITPKIQIQRPNLQHLCNLVVISQIGMVEYGTRYKVDHPAQDRKEKEEKPRKRPRITASTSVERGWKQRITRRENRLTRLAIDPMGNLSCPLLTRRANKGSLGLSTGLNISGQFTSFYLSSFPRTPLPLFPLFLFHQDVDAHIEISLRRSDRFRSGRTSRWMSPRNCAIRRAYPNVITPHIIFNDFLVFSVKAMISFFFDFVPRIRIFQVFWGTFKNLSFLICSF